MARRLLTLVLLAGLLATACGSSSTPAHDGGSGSGTGIRGQVLAGPTCPVERVGSPCPDVPTQAVVVALKRIGQAVGNVRTDSSGRFSLPLAPGTYLVYAAELGDNPRISKFRRTVVTKGRTVWLTLVIDTGIR